MNSEVIREFLVSVGVEVDENGTKRFSNAVEGITKTVQALGAAAAAMAAATAAAVVKVSDQFDELYYASQRLRASVTNIKAFGYGVSQMGGDAESARQSLEGLAEFMRSNPGGEGFLNSLGVGTRDAQGRLRDTTDVMRDLGQQFRAMPYYLAKMRAGMLGIDEGTLQALIRGTDLWSQEYADMAGNLDAAAEASARFMQMIRRLKAEFEIGLYKTLLRIQEAIGPGLEKAGMIAIAFFGALSRAAESLVDWLGKLDQETEGWSTALIAVASVLAVISVTVGGVVTLLAALSAAIVLLIDDFNVWKEGGKSFINWEEWAPTIDAAIAAVRNLAEAFGELFSAFSPIVEWIGKYVGPALEWFGRKFIDELSLRVWRLAERIKALAALMRGDLKSAAMHAWNADYGKPNTTTSTSARAAAAANDNRPAPAAATGGDAQSQAMNYFMRQGWTREQAAGIVANLQAESRLNPNAVGDGGRAYGAAQWHPDRQAEFKRVFGKDIRNSSLEEQLAFVQYELTRGNERGAGNSLRAAKSAREAGRVVSSQYERPADRVGEMGKRGNAAEAILAGSRLGQDRAPTVVNVNSKTDIKVEGGQNPRETAKVVETAADRAYAKLVRNTQGAVR